jgi:hypothetical protein
VCPHRVVNSVEDVTNRFGRDLGDEPRPCETPKQEFEMSAVTFPESEERLVRDQRELADLYRRLEELDQEILLAVHRRSHVSRLIAGRVRHPSVVWPTRDRFGELGADGHVLGRMLARLAHPHS